MIKSRSHYLIATIFITFFLLQNAVCSDVLVNKTDRKINTEIIKQYAYLNIQEFDWVNEKKELPRYAKDRAIIYVVKNEDHPDQCYVFVFFSLKNDTVFEPKKKKEYACAIMSLLKDGYIYPNVRGYTYNAVDDEINEVQSTGLGPDS